MTATTAGILPAKGATVDIFGRKVSWDALLVAGAGVAGVIFLYKYGQRSGSVSPMSTVGSAGGGGDTGTTGTVPTAPTLANLANPYAASNPYWVAPAPQQSSSTSQPPSPSQNSTPSPTPDPTQLASVAQIFSQTAPTGQFNPNQSVPLPLAPFVTVATPIPVPTSIPALNQSNPVSPYGRGN